MRACVFAGPSLGRDRPPLPDGVILLPPAARGDLHRAALRGPRAIGLIDGYFDGVPAVAHKEILWALRRGVHVLGASSMGALRAAELAAYGMVGVGEIFGAYASGELEGDDEVAVLHGPAEAGWVTLGEAMVNVCATLRAATAAGVLPAEISAEVATAAKAIFYKDRTWAAVLRSAEEAGVGRPALDALTAWLPSGRVDQKRQDALLLLDELGAFLAADPPPFRADFAFEHTQIWDDIAAAPDPDVAGDHDLVVLLLGELRLNPDAHRPLRERALARLLALREAEGAGLAVDEPEARRRLEDLRAGLGLFRRADRDTWLQARELDPDWLEECARGDALAAAVARDLAPPLAAALLDELRLRPDYPERLARARRKRELLEGAADQQPRPIQLLGWAGHRLGLDTSPPVAELARDLGFTDAEQFYRVLLAEHLYSVLSK